MKGLNLSEVAHFVPVVMPQNITGGETGIEFNMAKYAHASILIQIGVSAAAITSIVLKEATDADGTGATAIAFSYYQAVTTPSGDALSTKQTATSSGITSPSATDGIMYVIELDASQLSDGSNWVQLVLNNGSNNVDCSAVAILTGARYAGVASPTVTA